MLLLLHGYPTSSFMFRQLIPPLADPVPDVAPDHLGFGFSARRRLRSSTYTFEALAKLTRGLPRSTLVSTGTPIYRRTTAHRSRWRLALGEPDQRRGRHHQPERQRL